MSGEFDANDDDDGGQKLEAETFCGGWENRQKSNFGGSGLKSRSRRFQGFGSHFSPPDHRENALGPPLKDAETSRSFSLKSSTNRFDGPGSYIYDLRRFGDLEKRVKVRKQDFLQRKSRQWGREEHRGLRKTSRSLSPPPTRTSRRKVAPRSTSPSLQSGRSCTSGTRYGRRLRMRSPESRAMQTLWSRRRRRSPKQPTVGSNIILKSRTSPGSYKYYDTSPAATRATTPRDGSSPSSKGPSNAASRLRSSAEKQRRAKSRLYLRKFYSHSRK